MSPRAREPDEGEQANWGALNARMSNNEHQIQAVSSQVAQIQRDMTTNQTVLLNRIDSQAAKPTDLKAIVTAAVGVASLIGGGILVILNLSLSPVRDLASSTSNKVDLITQTRFSKDDATHAFDFMNADKVSKAEFTEAKNRLDERYSVAHEFSTAQAARFDKEIDRLGAEVVTKEDAAEAARRTDERISAIVESMNVLRHDFGTSVTLGDVVKDIQAQLKELRAQNVTPLAPRPPS
jgi:hypothetical protein